MCGTREKRYCERQVEPGLRVVDIGTNQGWYFLLLSHIVGEKARVYTSRRSAGRVVFGPERNLFESVCRNCQDNGATNIEMHNVAYHGQMKLYRSQMNSGDKRLPGAAIRRGSKKPRFW
jgi:hypothetical protein